MKEIKQMFWMMLGVLGGFGIGLYVLVRIIQEREEIADNSTLSLVLAIVILGGGLLGGGYLAQWLVYRYERAKRRKRQAEKDKGLKPKRRRKKKK